MSVQIKETAGDTLQGDVDGVNTVYEVSFPFNLDTVNIYVNGRLKIRDWDDGFTVLAPKTVILKEPLLPGDSLEIEYQADVKTGGGALGGCPSAPSVVVSKPGTMQIEQNVPSVGTDVLAPELDSEGPPTSTIVATALRPTILKPGTEC